MEFATNTFIRWFNPNEIVPSKDEHYLCQISPTHYATLLFSTKHQAFNVSGDNLETAIEVQWWAFLPELPQKETEDEE
jgi:hypothetical protein